MLHYNMEKHIQQIKEKVALNAYFHARESLVKCYEDKTLTKDQYNTLEAELYSLYRSNVN